MILTEEQRKQFFNPDAMEEYLSDRIAESKSIRTVMFNLAEASQKIEKPLQKNLYEISPKEYEQCFLWLDEIVIQRVRHMGTFVNDYNLWAYKTGRTENYVQVSRIIDFRTLDYSDMIKRKIIKSEEQFILYINGSIEDGIITNDIIASLLCWVGIPHTEIGEIKETDVLIDANKIVHKDKYFSVAPALMTIINKYMGQPSVYTRAGTRFKNDSKYLMKYLLRTEDQVADYSSKKVLEVNIRAAIRKFVENINETCNKEYSMESLTLSSNYWHIYKATKENPSDETINAYISDIVTNKAPTYLLDWRAGYDQYIKTYWDKK